jgi:N-acetylglutamate synthase-like GNAT family acetyltransferase
MKVRQARANDAAICASISHIPSATELKKLAKQYDTQWLVIEDNSGKVVGVGIINYWAWNKMAWILDLTVDEKERGKGYGSALLKGMLRAAKRPFKNKFHFSRKVVSAVSDWTYVKTRSYF